MRRFKLFCACFASLFAASCTTVPEYRDDEITTAEVIASIKCELRDAVWQPHSENALFRGWNAALTVTLEVFHKGGQSSNASLIVPLNPGTFTVALTSGATGQATRTERVSFKQKLKLLNPELRNSKSRLVCPSDPSQKDRHALLASHLGLADIFNRAREAIDLAEIDPHQLDYNITFAIKRDGSASASFAMIPVGDDNRFGGSVKLLGARNDTNSLKIVLQPPEKKKPKKCPIKPVNGQCPIAVYQVKPEKAPKDRAFLLEAPDKAVETAPPPAISPAEERSLDAGMGRNILQSIEEQLQREGIGN